MNMRILSYSLIVGGVFTLAGCANEVESVSNAVTESETVTNDIVTNMNEIIALEEDLQSQFNQTLNEDAELATLSDGSAPVYENIDSRASLLEDLDSNREELVSINESVESIEAETFSTEEIEGLYGSIETTSENLNNYVDSYQTFLDNQRAYFESLATEEANYETFANGIQSIQEEDATIQELVIQLNDNITALNDTTATLSEKLSSLESENQ